MQGATNAWIQAHKPAEPIFVKHNVFRILMENNFMDYFPRHNGVINAEVKQELYNLENIPFANRRDLLIGR